MAFDAGLLMMKIEAREQPLLNALDKIERGLRGMRRGQNLMQFTVRGGFTAASIAVSVAAASAAAAARQGWAAATAGISLLIDGVRSASVGAVGLASLASDAEEVGSKFDVVFGDQAERTAAELADFGQQVGRSRTELRRMAAGIQDTFVPLGFARGTAAELSVAVTKLATDLASFNNEADTDALEALQSALIGNHETVRRFGVIITEATLDQQLLAMGVEGGTAAATEQQKALARLQMILDGTTDAQGDATRTAGSFANMSKALQATVQDLGVELGAILIPALKVFMGAAKDALKWIQENTTGVEAAGQWMGHLTQGIVSAVKAAMAMLDFENMWQRVSLAVEERLTHVAERVEWFAVNGWNVALWFFTNLDDLAGTTAHNFVQFWTNVYDNVGELWAALWDYVRTGNAAGFAAVAVGMMRGIKAYNSSPAFQEFQGTDFSDRWAELDRTWGGRLGAATDAAEKAGKETGLDLLAQVDSATGNATSQAKFGITGVEELFRKNLLDRFETDGAKRESELWGGMKAGIDKWLAKSGQLHTELLAARGVGS